MDRATISSKNQALLILISALVTAVVVGMGVFYFVNRSKLQEIKLLREKINNLESAQATILEANQNPNFNIMGNSDAGLVFLAVKAPPVNSEKLTDEYFIISFNPESGEQKDLALIKNNFFNKPFGFSENKIFFLTPAGEAGSLDTKSGKQSVVEISGIIPNNKFNFNENTIFDFIVSDNKIFYLKGYCSEAKYCALGRYDISAGSNQIIVDDLHKQVEATGLSRTGLVAYDSGKNILKILEIGGGARAASASLYELDLETGALAKTDSANFAYCGEEGCAPEQESENEKFNDEKIFGKPQRVCNGVEIDDSFRGTVSVAGDSERIFNDAYFVGCVTQ
ncbi:MAG: hypothetical protein PHQ42_03225 [Patescibacteria group bacterium]|nr:hypothetical protein [Patescibacteria group bacterium]